MNQNKSPEKLARLLGYMLGRQPDEFGLIPDADGYVKIKDLLKAMSEDKDLRYVRIAHINEVLITLKDPPVEVKENLIRAKNREHLTAPVIAENPPALLYVCVRRRAYPIAAEKGIISSSPIILCSDKDMALRLGRRIDPLPVMLTVQVQKALEHGIIFHKSGEVLYLCETIPPGCFTGPPLPEEKPETKAKPAQVEVPKTPGSFMLDMELLKAQEKKKDKITREKDRKKARKQKQSGMW